MVRHGAHAVKERARDSCTTAVDVPTKLHDEMVVVVVVVVVVVHDKRLVDDEILVADGKMQFVDRKGMGAGDREKGNAEKTVSTAKMYGGEVVDAKVFDAMVDNAMVVDVLKVDAMVLDVMAPDVMVLDAIVVDAKAKRARAEDEMAVDGTMVDLVVDGGISNDESHVKMDEEASKVQVPRLSSRWKFGYRQVPR